MLKRLFLLTVLCWSRVDVGGELNTLGFFDGEDGVFRDEVDTLGDVAGVGVTWLGSVVEGTTLRDDASVGGLLEEVVESSGNGSIRFNCDDNSSKAFLTGSPAAKDGTVDDGGWVKMVEISEAACFKYLSQ